MFRLTVRDHIMIAHSFKGEVFGPAQRLHGATFVVDLELRARRPRRQRHRRRHRPASATLLKSVLAPLNYRNLDELPEFAGRNTTTEFLAARDLRARARRDRRGRARRRRRSGARGVKVTLRESHVAWASYEAAAAR